MEHVILEFLKTYGLNIIVMLICFIALGKWLDKKLSAPLDSYLSEKGKNIATKQDIAEITRKVGEVQKEFALSSERESSWQLMQRTAVIELYQAIANWEKEQFEFTTYFKDLKQILDWAETSKECTRESRNAIAKMELCIADAEPIVQGNKVIGLLSSFDSKASQIWGKYLPTLTDTMVPEDLYNELQGMMHEHLNEVYLGRLQLIAELRKVMIPHAVHYSLYK